MAYQTLFNRFEVHHGNTCIQITPAQFMKRSFMLAFDLTSDGCASQATSVSLKTAKSASNPNSTTLSPRQ
jgi:hypothetical protein